jgi:hypothetical protein
MLTVAAGCGSSSDDAGTDSSAESAVANDASNDSATGKDDSAVDASQRLDAQGPDASRVDGSGAGPDASGGSTDSSKTDTSILSEASTGDGSSDADICLINGTGLELSTYGTTGPCTETGYACCPYYEGDQPAQRYCFDIGDASCPSP